jgi:hypothetical protein
VEQEVVGHLAQKREHLTVVVVENRAEVGLLAIEMMKYN